MKLYRQTYKTETGYTFRISLPGHKFTCLETFDTQEDASFAADLFKLLLVKRYRLNGNTMWPSLPAEVFSRLLAETGIDKSSTDDLFSALSASCKDYLLDGGHETLSEFASFQGAPKSLAPRDPERIRRNWLKRNYGITLEDFKRMAEEQSSACAICCRPAVKLCVDHDHATGKVRGLLCSGCNTALGGLRDSVTSATAAAAYLTKHGKL